MIINTNLPAQVAAHKANEKPLSNSLSRLSPGSRLTGPGDEVAVGKQNLTAAQSQIQDADMAEESTRYVTQNILVQSATAMLAQANSLPQSVLKLLQ